MLYVPAAAIIVERAHDSLVSLPPQSADHGFRNMFDLLLQICPFVCVCSEFYSTRINTMSVTKCYFTSHLAT